MTRHQRILIIASIITCYLIHAQGADKNTDENRPYEFGFTIEGQQHRHEEKDKNGIIKGEYGFITADGVYHITVYATDEQGRFRILSMKNIRYQDYKGLTGPPSSARQGHSLQLPSAKAVTAGQSPIANSIPTSKPQQEFEKISIEPPANSCSHCSLPTTSTMAPKIETSLTYQQNGGGNSQYSPAFYPKEDNNYNAQGPQTPGTQQGFAQGSNAQTQPNNYGAQSYGSLLNRQSQPNVYSGAQNSAQQPGGAPQQNSYNGAQNLAQGQSNGYNGAQGFAAQSNAPAQLNAYNGAQSGALLTNGPGSYGTPNSPQSPQSYGPQSGLGGQQGQEQSENAERSRSGKQYTGISDSFTPGQQNPAVSTSVSQARLGPNQKPVLTYAQMQIVDKNTDIHAKAPGERDGLPPGLKEDDMLKLLYTFNYTLGFQAHFEEGFTNGVKRGYYYTTGRNGVRTRIDYVADKDGFHPTLSQEVYDLISDDVPKEETEKDEKYGLKGYEFKWLYFPVETKSQQNAS